LPGRGRATKQYPSKTRLRVQSQILLQVLAAA